MSTLVKAVLLLGCSYVAASVGITVNPLGNTSIPINSGANITYMCMVTGDRQAIWEINNRQISGQRAREAFAEIGVFVSGTLGDTETQLTFTPEGRETYLALNQSNIPIRCTAFDNNRPVTDFGNIFFIEIYDVPLVPPNFSFNPDPNQLSNLTLSWDKPAGIPSGVPVNYTVTISGPRVNITTTVEETVYQFEDSNNAGCEEHTFSVRAVNPAGPGDIATREETIPISPDIRETTSGLQISSIDLSSDGGVRVAVNFPPGRTCSTTNFPINNYSVIIVEVGGAEVARTTFDVTDQSAPLTMPVVLDNLSGVQQDRRYEVFVDACISIACRNTTRIPLLTSDVQQASMFFFQNNIFMNCSFANSAAGRGCIFNLSLVNSSEVFYLPREEMDMASQCNVSSSQNMAYTSFQVMDWESDGTPGSLPIPLERPPDVREEANYTQLTGCTVPRPGLSGGAVAGIVLAILAVVVIAVVVAIVVAIVVYKLRTGKWFKLKVRREDTLAVDFERALLMEDDPPKETKSLSSILKRSLSKKSTDEFKVEEKSVDVKKETKKADKKDTQKEEQEKDIKEKVEVPYSPDGNKIQLSELSPSPEPVLHVPHVTIEPDAAIIPSQAAAFTANPPPPSLTLGPNVKSLDLSIINPDTAFTLDIVDDKKVRLHLNRALIRRVLNANKIRALDKKVKSKAKASKTTDSVPLVSLSMPSQVRVHEGFNEDSYVII